MSEEATEVLDQPVPKKSNPMILIVIVNVVLVGGVLAFMLLRDTGSANSADAKNVDSSASASAAPGFLMPMGDLVVNLADRDVNRYLKIGLSLELTSEDTANLIREREPLVRDAIITLTSSLVQQEIRSPEGKQSLRERITSRLEVLLGPNQVKNVYFTEFVVQ